MKHFFKYIFGLLVFTGGILVVLDIAYTKVFENEVIANKTKYLITLQNKHYDAIFLGSSRVDNHIVSDLFLENDIKILNAGDQGTNLKDNLLVLKVLIDNKVTFDRLFVQVDYGYNNNELSLSSSIDILPSIKKPIIKDFFESELEGYYLYYNIPFYRYAVNDYKIGFRGVFTNLFMDKRVDGVFNDYSPLFGTSEMKPYKLPEKISGNSDSFNKIEVFCKNNNIKVEYFTAPFCSQLIESTFTNQLSKTIINYNDYSRIYNDDALFSSCGHLNNKGAKLFTKRIIRDYFN